MVKQENKVFYIEPCDFIKDKRESEGKTDENSGAYNGIYNAPEDYCIAIDLDVMTYDRTMPYTSNNMQLHFTSHARDVDFMKGTNGYFTTNFTNISSTNPGSGNADCIGISSIDITYTSWFYPQVTIKFVDVRGTALMAPQENGLYRTLKYEQGTNGSTTMTEMLGGSFFKSLFSYPFPQFNLRVKGFYGKGVTLKLVVQNSKIDFNSETGDFEVIVNFIGEMYGLYTEIPMELIAISPYIGAEVSDNGIKYNITWENGTNGNGAFWYEGMTVNDDVIGSGEEGENSRNVQNKMYTYPELYRAIYEYLQNENKILSETEEGQVNAALNKELESLTNFINNHNENSFSTSWALTDEGLFFFSNDVITIMEKCLEEKDDKIKGDDFKELKNYGIYPPESALFVLYDLSSKIEDNKLIITYNKEREKKGTSESISITIDGNGKITYDLKMFSFCPKIFEKYVSQILKQAAIDAGGNSTNNFVFAFASWSGKMLIEDKINSNTEKKKVITDKLNGLKGFELSKTLGFTPTIKNMFKMCFAHLDTFMSNYFDCIDNIMMPESQTDRENIKIDKAGIETDFQYTERDSGTGKIILPPFTKFYRDNNGKKEEFFPSRSNLNKYGGITLNKELDEVIFVERLLNAARINGEEFRKIQEEIEAASQKNNEDITAISDFIPTMPYDVAYNTQGFNPYSFLEGKSINNVDTLNEIYIKFLSRLYQLLLYNNNGYVNSINSREDKETEQFAIIEAYNAFKKIYYINNDIFEKLDNGVGYNSFNFGNNRTLFCDEKNRGKKDEYYCCYSKKNDGVIKELYVPFGEYDLNSSLSKPLFDLSDFDFVNILNVQDHEYFDNFFVYQSNVFYEMVNNAKKLLSDDCETYGKILKKCYKNYNREFKEIVWNSKEKYPFTKEIFYTMEGIIEGDRKKELAYRFLCGIIGEDSLFNYEFRCSENGKNRRVELLLEGALYWKMGPDGKKCSLYIHYDNTRLNFGNTGQITFTKPDWVTKKRVEYCKKLFEDFVDGDFINILEKYSLKNKKNGEIWDGNNKEEVKENETCCETSNLNVTIKLTESTDDFKEFEEDADKKLFLFNINNANIINKEPFFYGIITSDELEDLKDNTIGIYKDNGNFQKCKVATRISEYGVKSYEIGYSVLTNIIGTNCKKEYTGLIDSLLLQNIFVIDIFNFGEEKDGEPRHFVNPHHLEIGLNNFKNRLKEYIKTNSSLKKENTDYAIDIKNDESDNFRLSLYNTLADLYNKWLCGKNRNRWKLYKSGVSTDEAKRSELNSCFHYIDSYYNDIGDEILVSPDYMSEVISAYISSSNHATGEADLMYNKASIYQFLSLMAQKCNMLFLALPCMFGMTSNKEIKDMFTAFPYGKCIGERLFDDTTSYVCLYPYSPSEHLNLGDLHKDDRFDIIPGGDLAGTINGVQPSSVELFKDDKYSIPAFGVTYAKQNQSFFSRISLNMDNQQITEYAIDATLNIASKAGETDRTTSVVGQDLFRVYSNYSYKCDVEMLGDMNIMPLMYFQLNNIPMFKGAYQVISVSHSIVPGNMTTKFTGVRMNRYAKPFVNDVPTYSLSADIDSSTVSSYVLGEAVEGNSRTDYESLDGGYNGVIDLSKIESYVQQCKDAGWEAKDTLEAYDAYLKECLCTPQNKAYCARGTFRAASKLIRPELSCKNMVANGNADNKTYWDNLVNTLGYYGGEDAENPGIVILSGASKETIKRVVGHNKPGYFDECYGAILVYYSSDGVKRHTQICIGKSTTYNKHPWKCDKPENYGNGFVYNGYGSERWTLKLFIPPKKPLNYKKS